MFKFRRNIYNEKSEFVSYLGNIEDDKLKIYIEERVIDQIKWYGDKSRKNQFLYKFFMIISIIISALIPVLTLMLDLPFGFIIKIIISALSSTITAISAIISLYNYRELWVQYRTNCEILKSTLHRFFMKNGEFANIDDGELYEKLVEVCENYITKEFETWRSIKITKLESKNNASV